MDIEDILGAIHNVEFLQPSKAKVSKIFSDLKSALKIGDKDKIGKILGSLDPEKLLSEKTEPETVRKILFESPNDDGEDDPTLVSRSSSNDADEKTSKRKVDKVEKAESVDSDDNDNEDDYSKVELYGFVI